VPPARLTDAGSRARRAHGLEVGGSRRRSNAAEYWRFAQPLAIQEWCIGVVTIQAHLH
jgi:hypothetical protein